MKEFFVFSDPDGNLYHLTVDGSVVKDGARLSPPVEFIGFFTMDDTDSRLLQNLLTRDHLLLNVQDKAIALLLNTDPEHDQFYSNHLLACLSAILQPAGCRGNGTLKLVATYLIALLT